MMLFWGVKLGGWPGILTLFLGVMKAKYFRHENFLDASLGYSCSYSWKSIWSVKALIKEGFISRVGDGASIDIWEDSWICGD